MIAQEERFTLHHGDCLDVLRTLPDASVDAVVTDPPYGLAFMGKRWDYDVPSVDVWGEVLRVLKPGGHLLAFAGTRTQHRMAVRIEDAGFEIRDMIAWVYGSGFPKSLDVSKAIDKTAGHWRGRAGEAISSNGSMSAPNYERTPKGDPVTAAAAAWQGWGTALKPAMEPITVARKPFKGNVAENVLTHGTGAINVDGCRVGSERLPEQRAGQAKLGTFERYDMVTPSRTARWPANVIHDGSEEVLEAFNTPADPLAARRNGHHGPVVVADPSRSAARFFYCAKASKRDRDEGCEGLGLRIAGGMSGRRDGTMGSITMSRNTHPTVKPTELMRYLCRLITPPGGTVLDPFAGSGSTGKAAMLEGFKFIGIEREQEYIEIATARIQAVLSKAESN